MAITIITDEGLDAMFGMLNACGPVHDPHVVFCGGALFFVSTMSPCFAALPNGTWAPYHRMLTLVGGEPRNTGGRTDRSGSALNRLNRNALAVRADGAPH